MSEFDERAFTEYTTKAISRQLRIPVGIVCHELYKWIVEENNDNKNIVEIKKYAELTLAFAKDHPEMFAGNEAQQMLKEMSVMCGEIRSTVKMGNFVKPAFLYMPNTKLSNCLFDKNKDLTVLTALIVSGEKEEKVTVKTQVFLSLEENCGVSLPQNITAYDRAVHDGICSIYAAGNNTMTTRQIYEAMTGKPTKNHQQLGHITRSIMKLRQTLIYIDYTDQAKIKGIDCKKLEFNGNLLKCDGVDITFNNGEIVSGYKLDSPPILYKYALEMGQIISANKSLLSNTKVSNTEDSIVLRHYLLRRIETMKNHKNNMGSNRILFDTMFNYCNIDGNREQLRRKRDIVFSMLKEWQDVGYIKEFKEYRGKLNKVLGIEISPI